MAEVPYKASKAWHFGHTLADEIRGLSEHMVAAGETDLAKRLLRAAASIHKHLADSYRQVVEADREHCYQLAHDAASELEAHLSMLAELEIVNSKTMKRWRRQAETISQQLAGLLPQAQPAILTEAITEEDTQNHGTINNRVEEGDPVRPRGPAVPRRRLQPESDGARRINRKRPDKKPTRRQSPRENIQG